MGGVAGRCFHASPPSSCQGARRSFFRLFAPDLARAERRPRFWRCSAIADLALKQKLPAIGHVRNFADSGGLMAYGVDQNDQMRRAATYVDRILKGARPADLPVQQPSKFQLVINLKTAKALGLTIPQSVLLRADQVIE